MAAKVRGITIELQGDTTGLTKSLNDANKEIKSTQTQLKDVEKLLKLDPTNVELLRQKQELLNKAIADSNAKLDTLKKAEENMKANGVDENSEQFMALQREIVSTEADIKKLQTEADNMNLSEAAEDGADAFEDLGEATEDTTEKVNDLKSAMDKVSKAAQTVADKTKKLSAAGAAVAGGLIASSVASMKSADELKTLSARTGLSTDMLQKFAYASEMVDVSTEEMAGSVAKMKKQMANAPQNFEELGIELRNADGSYRSLEDVFFDSLTVLSQVGDETERDILAMQLFGKSGDALATIIDDGGAALKEYGDRAEELGLILSNDTLLSMVDTKDKIDELKASATATIAEVGAELLDKLAPTIELIVEKIGELVEWIGTLDGDTLETILTVAAVVAAISPLASIISGITSAIGAVSTAIEFLLANPIVALIAAIVGLVVLIATKGDEIQAILQNVDDWLSNVFSKDFSEQFGFLGDIINVFVSVVDGIWTAIKTTLDGVINFIRGVFTGDWDRAWKGIEQIFTGVIDGAKKIFDGLTKFFSKLFSRDWKQTLGVLGNGLNAFFANFKNIWESIKTIFNGVITFIKGVFAGNWKQAWEGVKSVFSGIFDGLGAIAKAPINVIIGALNGLIDGINWCIRGVNKISFSVPDWVPVIGGKSVGFNISEIGKLAYLAEGGILKSGSAVVGENGAELLTMMGDRAVVQPLTNNTTHQNYGGVTLNIYGAAGQNVQELAEIIMDEIASATQRQEAAFA